MMINKKLYLWIQKYLLLMVILFLSFTHLMYSYTITSSVVDTHGNKSTGGTYEMLSAGGQTAIGNSSGGSYTMGTGFVNTTIAPKAITNLSASQGSYIGSIKLTWIYPETLIAGSSYYIQYSTFNSDTVWNCNNAQVIKSTNVSAGGSANIIVGGLDVGRGAEPDYPVISPDYYFRIWVRNGNGLVSDYSNYASTHANTPNAGTHTLTNYSDGWLITRSSGFYNIGYSTVKDNDENIYIIGVTSNTAPGTLNNSDIIFIKYNSSGNVQWEKYYNSPSNRADYGYGIVIDEEGYFYITGQCMRSDIGQGNNILTIKYDNSNSPQMMWIREYHESDNDSGNKIITDSIGNIFVVGQINGYPSLMKYNSAGLLQWTTTYGEYSGHWYDGSGTGINIDDDNPVIVGQTGGSVLRFRKYNSLNGELIWSKDEISPGRSYSIVIDNENCKYITTTDNATYAKVIKYDSNDPPEKIWISTTTNVDLSWYGSAVDKVNNSIYVCGRRMHYRGDVDLYIKKYSNNIGYQTWKKISGFPYEEGYQIIISTNNGNIYVTGKKNMGADDNLILHKFQQSYLIAPIVENGPGRIEVSTFTVYIDWNDSNYESSYTIKTADGFVKAETDADVSECTIVGLSPNSSTSVYITAYNTWASSSSALITTYTLSNPATGSYIISSDDYKIKIGWGGNNNPAYTRWGVLRSTDTNFTSTTTIKDFTDNYTQTTYSDKNVLPETTYYYKICAYNNNQVITNYDTVISTLTLPKDEKIVINEIASCEGTDMIEFYVSQTGAYGGYTVYEGTACIKTFPNSGDWVNGNMINGTYIMLYLNSPAGTDETEINGSLIKIYSDYTGINATDNIIYLSSSNGLGFKADGVVSATSTVVDIVAYANQDLTELSSAYKNNIASMTTIGLWNYEGIEPKQIDCVNSRGLTTTGKGIARDDVSRRSGDKYDWMYMNILSTGGVNIATTSVSGLGGASTSTPTGLGVIIGTTTTVTINYISTSTYSDIGHMITIDIPTSWTEPQIINPYSAGYTTTTLANFSENYGITICTGIPGIAGRIIVPLGNDLTTGTTISIKYGDISISTGGYAIAQNTIGRAVFLVSSDNKGTNVEPITSCSPEIRVTDAYGGGGAPRFVGPNPDFVLGEVYSFPNPAKRGRFPTIHIECGIADRVIIGIYNVAAEPIHSTELTDLPLVVNGKYAYEYTWDITDIASGVYVYIIRAKKAGFSDIKAQGKTAIIK